MKNIENRLETCEIVAHLAPDGQALVRLAGRELFVSRRDQSGGSAGVGLCPLELIGVALAA